MTLAELKKFVGNKKLILGSGRTIKLLKKGELKEIFLSSNMSKASKSAIETHAKMMGVKVSELGITNEEMGVVVKKPFGVSVASIQK